MKKRKAIYWPIMKTRAGPAGLIIYLVMSWLLPVMMLQAGELTNGPSNSSEKNRPDNPALVVEEVRLLIKLGRLEEAEKMLQGIGKQHASRPDVIEAAGLLNAGLRRWRPALEAYEKLRTLEPDRKDHLKS